MKVSTLEQFHSDAVALPRFRTLLLMVFAGLAAALATAGVYGVDELRRPPSARRKWVCGWPWARPRGDVVSILVGNGAKLAAIGLACGLAIALLGGPVDRIDAVRRPAAGPGRDGRRCAAAKRSGVARGARSRAARVAG